MIDCANVKGELVVFEWQKPLNSGIQKEVFLKLIHFFDKKLFVTNGMINKVGVSGKNRTANTISEPFFGFKTISMSEFLDEFDPKKEFPLGQKNLIILDSNPDGPYWEMHINALYRLSNWNTSWVSLDGLDPSETIFRSKRMQRLILSGK